MAASLVERAVGHAGWGRGTPAAAPPSAPVRPVPPAETEPTFRLVWRRLARQGFLTPATLNSPLARELSAAKRRLVRRLDLFGRPEDARGSVLVTSAEPGEGKSFLAVNLALSLALEERLPVVLVDADLQSPSLERLLDLPPRRGLGDRLADPAIGLDGLLHRADGLPLSVLAAGGPRAAPARLLASPALPALLHELAQRHPGGVVILDGPPVLATNEAPVLAQAVAEIVLVVAAGKATEATLAAALELLDAGERVALLLNRSRTGAGASTYARAYGGQG